MGIIVKDSGGQDFEVPSVGVHRAICITVDDLGLQPGFNQGDNPKEQVFVLWELEEKDSKGKHFTIGKFYTKSIHEKSTLGKDLVSWRGRPFTEAERAAFDLDNIKGKPCQLNLVPTPAGKVKVQAVMYPSCEVGTDGKRHITLHWAPETDSSYIHPAVSNAREKAIHKPATSTPQTGADGFTDDVPGDW